MHKFTKIIGAVLIIVLATCDFARANPLTPTPPQLAACSFPDVILGTLGDDVILGTPGDDVICGLGGDDKIDGLGGDDLILGGDGNDIINGGNGDDTISGEIGSDYLEGADGNDDVWGGDGEDSIFGGPLDDYLAGGIGSDGLFGDPGIDTLLGDEGNDSLNGGLGSDSLSGGPGTNTCAKDKADKTSKCFFDMRGPVLSAIAIASEDSSLDSSDPDRKLHVRFKVSDPGTGLKFGYLTFSDSKTFQRIRKDPTSSTILDSNIYINFQIEDVNRCNSDSWIHPGTCRIDGDSTNGTYQSTVTLPRNLYSDRYYLTTAQFDDQVGHVTSLSAKSLVAAKKAISFQQIGTNDVAGPRIIDINFPEAPFWNEESSTIFADVKFLDEGGNGIKRLALRYQALSTRYSVDLEYRNDWSGPQLPLCSSISSTENTIGCFIEGDNSDGTLRLPLKLGGYSGFLLRGTKKLVEVEAMDYIENISNYKKLFSSLIAKTLVYQKFGRNGLDTDHVAPQVTYFRASRSHINTSTSSQVVTFTMKAKDSGTGIGYADISVFSSEGTGSLPFCIRKQRNLSGNKYVEIVATCTFPAHFPSGNFLVGLLIEDLSTNSNNTALEGSELTRFGFSGYLSNSE